MVKIDKPLFCIAPWVSSHQRSNGLRSPCIICNTAGDYEKFSDWWNSEELKEARRTFIAGDVPEGCAYCVESNRTAGNAANASYIKQFGHHLAEILDKTETDGSTTFMPRTADYRTIHCNLRCRTCDGNNSSAILSEEKKLGRWFFKANAPRRADQFLEDNILDQLEHIYWAGGEPFMSPAHKPVMDELLANGRHKDIHVHYTSNLMHLPDRLLTSIKSYGDAFAGLSIGASIDGLYENGEYIRTDWRHEVFFENIARIRKEAPAVKVLLEVTLTNLGMFDIKNMILVAQELGIPINIKLMEVNQENDFLSIDLLTPEFVIEVLTSCKSLRLNDDYRGIVPLLAELIKRRYRPIFMNQKHFDLLRRSESIRGKAGWFEGLLNGKLNLETIKNEETII